MNKLMIVANGLIPVYKDENGQVVDARELYEFLESRQDFTDWIKNRIGKYGFVEGEDFTIILGESTGGRPSTEYALNIDTAKEIAMVENNDKGRIIRKYFIEVEKRAGQPKQMTMTEIIAASAQQLVEMERKVLTLDSKIANVLDVFTAPTKDDWKHDMSSKINQIVESQGFSHQKFRGDLYEELECLAHCDITARQSNLRKRMKEHGATYKDCAAATKLDVVDRDAPLRVIFEGIVRKYQAKFA